MTPLDDGDSCFMRFPTLLLAAVASFALVGCTRAAEDTAFDAKVRAYLLAHPEVIQEAVEKLQEKRQSEAEAQYKQSLDKGKAALPRLRQALERDPRDFVANAGGKVTVTEFYDYRCPHCINVAPKVVDLIKSNPDIRFVFKEMPIFGATSEHAARAALAVKAAGGDYVGFYHALMSTRGLNDAEVDELSRAKGVDPAKAEAAATRTAADAQIADVHKLAASLYVDGTPTFIIGDEIIPGEDMDAVQAAIVKARSTPAKG